MKLRFEWLISKYIDDTEINLNNLENRLHKIIERLNYLFYSEQSSNSIYSLISRLEANAQILRIDYIKNLKNHVDSFFQKSSPVPCLEYLESIELLLKDKIQYYQNALDGFIEEEKSAFLAYNVILKSINGTTNRGLNREELDSLTRAILYIYRSKMQIEAYTQAIQIIRGIIRHLQFYIDDLILTINLLNSINNQLNIFEINKNISLSIQQNFDIVSNSAKLLKEIESEIGYSINQWGTRGHVNSSFLLERLSDKVSTCSNNISENIHHA